MEAHDTFATEHDDDEEPLAAPDEVQASSILDDLRARRQEISQRKTVDLEVPGYDGKLVVRYRRLEWEELSKIGNRAEKSKNPRKVLIAHVDTIVGACEEVFYRQVPGGPLVRLADVIPDNEEGLPVKYDQRLADFFGVEGGSARKVCLAVFNNPLAVPIHHNELAEWMQLAGAEDDEGFTGSS